jgi:hypothetical protein
MSLGFVIVLTQCFCPGSRRSRCRQSNAGIGGPLENSQPTRVIRLWPEVPKGRPDPSALVRRDPGRPN